MRSRRSDFVVDADPKKCSKKLSDRLNRFAKTETIFYLEKALLLVAPVVELYLYKVLEANLRNLHNNACF